MLSLELKEKFKRFLEANPEWQTRLKGLQGDFDFGYAGWNDRVVTKDMRHRVLFEVNKPDGSVFGLCGRSVDGRVPKYKHPIGYQKGKALYNIGRCKLDKPVILTEGNIDAMRCHVEFQQAVALEGINMTQQQEKLLCQFKRVMLGLDKDDAGKMATIIIASRILRKTDLYLVDWEGAKDIDELYLSGRMIKQVVSVNADVIMDVWFSCQEPTKQISLYNHTVYALFALVGGRRLMEHGIKLPEMKMPSHNNLNNSYHSDKKDRK